VRRIAQATAAGLVLGAAWGALEGLVIVLRPYLHFWIQLRARPPLDLADLGGVLLLGGLHYGVLAAFGCALAVLVCRPWLAGRDTPLFASRLVVGVALFANLYWHTKSLWAFSWGLPFHHWKRLLLTVAWLVVAGLLARVLVRPAGPLRPPSRRLALVVALLLGGGAVWALPREAAREAGLGGAPAGAPNVLMVVVDALRQDRLGCYGRQPSPSPRVDGLAGEGVVFESAATQAPFTWTSFGSFLTGKYPREHGLIKMSPDQSLDVHGNRTIAQALQEAGYATGAFLTGTLSNDTGLLHGFDTYFETIVGHEAVNRYSKWSVVRSRMLLWILFNKSRQALDPRLVNTEALSWIREHAGQPFFALVHYYSTHTPYDPPAPHDARDPDYRGTFHPFRQQHGQWVMAQQQAGRCEHDGKRTWSCEHFDPQRDVAHIDALYDGGVAFADEMFGDLLDALADLGIDDETLVVFTSDHGEELYDHGLFEHDWMFETNLAVPLVMRLPGRRHAGARVPWPVELRDIPATILAVTGAGTLADPGHPTARPPGRSLLPDIEGVDPGPGEKDVFSENVRYVALRESRYKLVKNRFVPAGPEAASRPGHSIRLFDLEQDPGEHRPLDRSDPAAADVAAELLARLKVYDDSMPEVQIGGGGLDPEKMQQLGRNLAALGYTQWLADGSVPSDVAASDEITALLAESQFKGSNEILEEELYERPFQWPPGCNGRPPDASTPGAVPDASGERGAAATSGAGRTDQGAPDEPPR